MSSIDSQRHLVNGHVVLEDKWALHTAELRDAVTPSVKKTTHNALGFKDAEPPQFHGDALLGDKTVTATGVWDDLRKVFTPANAEEITKVGLKLFSGQGLDVSRCPMHSTVTRLMHVSFRW